VEFTIGDDEKIMLQYQQGDTSRIEELIRRHSGWVYHILCKWTKNNSEAEDLAQDTWRKVFTAAPSYRPSAPFGSWLFNIARNTFLDWTKKKRDLLFKKQETNSDCQDHDPISQIPDTAFESKPVLMATKGELFSSFHRCIGSLKDEHKALVDMFREDKTQRDMAETFSIALGTVNKRLKVVFKILMNCLEKAGWSAIDILEDV